MSLDIYFYERRECEKCGHPHKGSMTEQFNITHNLTNMADECGLYEVLWHPEDLEIKSASEMISRLELGIKLLQGDPEFYKQFNPENGWGTYDGFLEKVLKIKEYCIKNPTDLLEACR